MLPMDASRKREGYPDLLPAKARKKVGELYGLARQEVRVLRLLCQGFTNGAIASHLDIRLPTVRTHLRSIYAKLDCADRVQVILKLVHGFVKK